MEPERALERLRVLETTLWQERNLLHYLHFRLVVADVVLAADAADFVTMAVQEIDQLMRRVREAERFRAAVVREAAAELGVAPADLTLEYLAAATPDGIRHLFEDHRAAFLHSEAVMELQLRETAYQAALAAFSHSSQPSLLDSLA